MPVFGVDGLPLSEPAWIFSVLMLSVLVAPAIARLARIPDLVGLILVGTVIGPNVLGLLERTGMVAALGGAGLLYLMFVAGLELDLHELGSNRRASVVFGIATFVLPMVIGTIVIGLMGFELLAAILLASCWASHTLLTYPVFRRFGVATNRAVAASVGATIITDTAALLVLVVVARAYVGGLDIWFWLSMTGGLVVLGVATLWALPRLARWFFAVVGRDRHARLIFLLVALFFSGVIAELAGIEAIIGAFLAGLALNRLVPQHSELMDRVEVLGSSLLIPLFLLSIGMLVDPRLLIEPTTLGVAIGFIAVALGAKWLAAAGSARLFGFGPAERGAMFALSSAQAAATLAAVFIGLEVELLTTDTVNAVVVVILVTCVVSSVVAGRVAPKLAVRRTSPAIGTSVIVPIARPESAAALARFAAAIARRDGGLVVPVTVVGPGVSPLELRLARGTGSEAERVVRSAGVEVRAVTRVDQDPVVGIRHAIAQEGGSLLVVGWTDDRRGGSRFGPVLEQLVDRTVVPTLVARLQAAPWGRIVLLLTAEELDPAHQSSQDLAVRVISHLRRDLKLPVLVLASDGWDDSTLLVGLGDHRLERSDDPVATAAATLLSTDLIITSGSPDPTRLRAHVGRTANQLSDHHLVVAIGQRSAAAPGVVPGSGRAVGASGA